METEAFRKEDFEIVRRFLPTGWEAQAKQLGALRRARGFADAERLLRTLLIHIADGCSLRETVVRAERSGLANVSDVALLLRLKGAGEWLRWMAEGVMRNWMERQPEAVFGAERKVRILDGTTVQEPGARSSTWRIHYSVRLPDLHCDEVHLTATESGETFKRFGIRAGELVVADGGYAHYSGIAEVNQAQAQVLVRINLKALSLEDQTGAPFPLLPWLRTLTPGQCGNAVVVLAGKQGTIPGRVCAIAMSKTAAERARKRVRRDHQRKYRRPRPETLEAAGYVIVFTTVPASQLSAAKVLELYRGRWQVELVFKRLKSLLGLGHLKKSDPEAARAWLHGKLLVAFLIEALIDAGPRFFPWGYPVAQTQKPEPLA